MEATAEKNYLNSPKGIWSWIVTLDHKRIGLMYLISILVYFLAGGIYALLVRSEHWTPEPTLMDASTYNQAFTYHGILMVFLVIIPMIPAALGNMVLPIMLGAKDVAFPRLNLLSYYVFMVGAVLGISTLFLQGIDTGWTFYTPYSTKTASSATIMLFAAFIIGFSSILTGLNFIASIHKLRAPGLTWGRLPLFLWSLYATSIIQLLATPVVAITLCLVLIERVFHIGIFDPNYGGDPILMQHFFWFYSHPAVYIMILPAMGVINEVLPVFSRKPIFAYKAMALSIFGIAMVSFIVWGHHMYTSGQSATANFAFSILTMFVGVPTGVKVFGWLVTLYKGSIHFKAPMLYVFAFLFVFTIGGLTGVILAAIATDIHLHDTYFVVAHFHYVMVGGSLMGFLAGLHYWFPKFLGRMYSETGAFIAWIFIFLGFNVTFIPQFIMGTQGMPRRYYNYLPEFQYLHQISTVGSFMIALGFVITAIYLIQALLNGKRAPANPWGALTLEWKTPSPPPTENFEVEPVVQEGFYEYRGNRAAGLRAD